MILSVFVRSSGPFVVRYCMNVLSEAAFLELSTA
jgi:hypothetical protein